AGGVPVIFACVLGGRGRGASAAAWGGCARRSPSNGRDGGGGRRRSRPRPPPAPPQAAWAPSTWVAAPLVSPITTREPPLGSLPATCVTPGLDPGGPSFFARTFCQADGLPGQARQ